MTPFRLLTLIIAMIGSMCAHAKNSRQYFPEGTYRDTLMLTNSDHANMSVYTAVEIRASVPGTKEQTDYWHEGFGIQIASTDSSHVRVMLYPANSNYGFLGDTQGMALRVWHHSTKGDSTIISKIMVDNMAEGRYENSLSVETHRNGTVEVFAGKNRMEKVAEFHYPDATQGERYAVIEGEINVTLLVDEFTPDVAAMLQTEWSLSKLQEHFNTNRSLLKPLEGYWQYLDQDTDENYAHIGGRYRLALVDNGADGYNIIYVSGALISPNLWQCGMLKGSIEATIFPDNYDLNWIDSEMQPVNREAYAMVEQNGNLLSLTIPTLKSTMRLYRVPWDK